ncbi:MAG: hypothetical protein ACRDV1_02400 [Actinomycetes bacterium]
MPPSRSRRRAPSAPDRRRAQARGSGQRLTDNSLLTFAHHAENRMLYAEALATLRRRRSVEQLVPGWVEDLQGLVAEGDKAEAWRFARWLGHAAFRWLTFEPDERAAAPAWAFVEGRYGGAGTVEDAVRTAMANPWVHDAVLFDLGGFDDYLSRVAPSAAVERCPLVRDWCAQPVRLLRCTGSAGRADRYADEMGGAEFTVRRVGGPPVARPGGLVLARPLPVPGDPAHIFLLSPVLLEPDLPIPTAADLDRAPAWLGWLGRCLGECAA